MGRGVVAPQTDLLLDCCLDQDSAHALLEKITSSLWWNALDLLFMLIDVPLEHSHLGGMLEIWVVYGCVKWKSVR